MYYEDLTPYEYFAKDLVKCLNVGWLEKGKYFPVGKPSKEFLERLDDYEEKRYYQTKGLHSCQFCEENVHSSNEIRVVGKDGKVYASPRLIFHYVKTHDYLPPSEFIEAVLNGPRPRTEEYENAVKNSMLEIANTFFKK